MGRKEEKSVVLVGDGKVGKSSIASSAISHVPIMSNVMDIIPPFILSAEFYPDQFYSTSVIVTDTSADNTPKEKEDRELAIKLADVVCICYDLTDENSLRNVSDFWIPYIQSLRISRVPIILLGNKLESVRTELNSQIVDNLMRLNYEIIYCIDCSCKNNLNIKKLFSIASSVALHPPLPLFSFTNGLLVLSVKYESVLQRLFHLLDKKRTGTLGDAAILQYQKICYPKAEPTGIKTLKETIRSRNSTGIENEKINIDGFKTLHRLLVEKMEFEAAWTLLRYYGYDNDLEFSSSFLFPRSLEALEEEIGEVHVELNDRGIQFFEECFDCFTSGDDSLCNEAAYELFKTTPNDPFTYHTEPQKTSGGTIYPLSKQQFIFMWKMVTLFQYKETLRYMRMLGYTGDIQNTLTQLPRNTLKQGEKSFFYLLILSSTPKQESLLTPLNQVDFLGTPSGHISYQGKTICVQQVSIYKTPTGKEMKDLEYKFAKSDMVGLMFNENDSHSFQSLTSLYSKLQVSCDSHCSKLVLISSTLNGFPSETKDFGKVKSGYFKEKGVKKMIQVSFSRDYQSYFPDFSETGLAGLTTAGNPPTTWLQTIYPMKWRITGSLLGFGGLAAAIWFLIPRIWHK